MSLLVSLFRNEINKKKDSKIKAETESNVFYSTGFLAFDFRNGTIVHSKRDDRDIKYYGVGITDGSLNTLIGRSGCGKTSFAIQSAANIVRNFENSAIFYEDIEGGITESRKMQLTGFDNETLKRKLIHRNVGITAENFYERIKMIADLKEEKRSEFEYDTGLYDANGNRIFKLQPTVVILDSLALLMPGKYTDEEDLSGQMAATAAAKTNSAIFKRLIPMIKSVNIILFVINHINDKVDINPFAKSRSQVQYLGQDETLPGGRAAIYLCNTMIKFIDNTKLKESEGFGIRGNFVDLQLLKSRTSAVGSDTVTLVFDQDNGYDKELSLLVNLKNEKYVTGSGAYFSLSNRPDLKFTQKGFKEKLATNEEFKIAFEELCSQYLVNLIEKHNVYNNDVKNLSYDITDNIMKMANDSKI